MNQSSFNSQLLFQLFQHRQYSILEILVLEFIKSASLRTTCLSNFSWSQYNEVLACNLFWVFFGSSEGPTFSFFEIYFYHSIKAIILENVFLVLFGGWNLFFCDKKLFKIFLYLCIYFVQEIAELVLERLLLLHNS